MSSIIKSISGYPAQGSTIVRKRSALKGAAILQGSVATYLGLKSAKNLSLGNIGWGLACFTGAAIALYNVVDYISKHNDLKPAYDKIVARAKNIYKNK